MNLTDISPEMIIAGLLFIIISQIGILQLDMRKVKKRLKRGAEVMTYLNHRITAITRTFEKCGITLLEEVEEEDQDSPPPFEDVRNHV